MALFSQILVNIATAATMARPAINRVRLTTPRMAALGGPEVTVLGGGFGGLYTALRLVSLDWSGGPRPRVTLVDRHERFAFSPMLYELATGTATCWEVAPLYEDLLAGTGIDFVRGEVRGLDEAEQVVRVVAPPTANGEARAERLLPYDQCVLAFGSQPTLDRVEGAAEYAQPFYSTDDALAVKRKVRQLREDAADSRSALRVCVVGGGYIGAELAANLASSLPSSEVLLTLVHRADALLTSATDHSRDVAVKKLADAGVDVILNTEVELVTDSSIRLVPVGGGGGGGGSEAAAAAAGEPEAAPTTRAAAAARAVQSATTSGYDLPVDLTLWTAGSEPSSIVQELQLPLDASGRIAVEPTLKVVGKPGLYALGDASAVTDANGARSPSTAQAAMQQADYTAWNVRASLRGEGNGLPFRYLPLGEMLSLGSDAASISALGQLVKLSGPLGSIGRRAVYAARMPTPRQAAKVGLSWAVDAAFGALRKAAVPPSQKK